MITATRKLIIHLVTFSDPFRWLFSFFFDYLNELYKFGNMEFVGFYFKLIHSNVSVWLIPPGWKHSERFSFYSLNYIENKAHSKVTMLWIFPTDKIYLNSEQAYISVIL